MVISKVSNHCGKALAALRYLLVVSISNCITIVLLRSKTRAVSGAQGLLTLPVIGRLIINGERY